MPTYFYYQKGGKDSPWKSGLYRDKEEIVEREKPIFTTVLSLNTEISENITAEDMDKIRYLGPLYFDLDNADIEVCIKQFKKLLVKLEENHVRLQDVHLYATGGRGFHIEIPVEVFLDKVVPQGYMHLPHIYKEMVYSLYVDSVDLAVYSARRGRMWRVPGEMRDNGKYKTYITPEQAKTMTVEMYEELTSTYTPAPEIKAPEYSPTLGLAFVRAKQKVESAKKGSRRTKADQRLVTQWGGKFPDTLAGMMKGENLNPEKGFQSVALQLAISAAALGKKEEEFLEACEGIIENHVGDSTRYGTPAKRRAELSRMYAYMHENPCYEFSTGALKSILAPGTKTPDLDGGFVDEELLDADGNPVDIEDVESLTVGTKVAKSGIWKRGKDGEMMLACSLGLDNPSQLIELDMGAATVIGYAVDSYLEGKFIGRKLLTMDMLTSAHNFLKFVTPFSASMQMNDAHVRALPDILRKRTEMTESRTYTVKREGVDMVRLPTLGAEEYDMIFAHSEGVESARGNHYQLRPQYGSTPTCNSDLHRSPTLAELAAERPKQAKEFFHKFLSVNTKDTVAKVFGFMLASFVSQPIRREYSEFPLLQIYGTAGSGKSAYIGLASYLHYYKRPPHIIAADGATKFTLEQAFMSSASIPIVLDEVKPREMQRGVTQTLKQMLRNNYNGNAGGKGRINRDQGNSQMSVTRIANECPLVFIGEALEAQSAIMDRCIIVTMTPEGRAGKSVDFRWCQEHREFLSALGRSCVDAALTVSHDWLKDTRKGFLDLLYPSLGERAERAERPIKNYATCLTGLRFGQEVLRDVFGDEFDDHMSALQKQIVDNVDGIVPFNMSEASKALNTLAYMTTLKDYQALNYNEDYGPSMHNGIECIDIVLRNAYDKYARFQKARGEELLFDTEDAFFSAMSSHAAVVDRVCADAMGGLKKMPSTKVFRLRLDTLYQKERVEEFADIPNPYTRK